jgi:hypothetical protein
MGEKFESTVERLQEAGFTFKTPMPEEYEEAIESLSEEEIAALVSVKLRLDEAQASTERDVAPYTEFVWPF